MEKFAFVEKQKPAREILGVNKLSVRIYSNTTGNKFCSDFGANYPSEWLYDGFKMSPDFDYDKRMISYSGT